MRISKKVTKIVLVYVLLTAYVFFALLVLKPWITRTSGRAEAQAEAEAFLRRSRPQAALTPNDPTSATEASVAPVAPEGTETEAAPLRQPELYAAMREYNEKIYAEGQSGLCDPWSCISPAIDLTAYGLMADEVIGVLQIPSIEVSLPIYCGASSAHLNKGAAVLGQTSLPIGGENTNTVIGAHRGWNAEDYLRDVEEVQPGDEIIITNFWGELRYTVTEIKVIEPDDIKQILIQPGRELLTVFTCHPYASGGRYRYLLICDRVVEQEPSEGTTLESALPSVTPATAPRIGTEIEKAAPTVCIKDGDFRSATREIRLVAILPWIGIVILMATLITVITMLYNKRGGYL